MISRFIKIALPVVLAALLLSGCMNYTQMAQTVMEQNDEPTATQPPLTEPMYTDREALYQYYNQVTVAVDTLDTLAERFGEPTIEKTDNGDTYVWKMDDGYGFVVVLFDSKRVRAKVVYYDDIRQLGLLSSATGLDQISSLNTNFTYEMTCGLLGGRSMELCQIAQDSSAAPEIKRVFVWGTEKGDIVQILFKGNETLENITYSMAEEENP